MAPNTSRGRASASGSGAKIIIKPLLSRGRGKRASKAVTPVAQSPAESTEPDEDEDVAEDGNEDAASSSALPSTSQTPDVDEEGDAEGEERDGEKEDADVEEDGEAVATPAADSDAMDEDVDIDSQQEVPVPRRGRGRGRPRGRGRGSAASGTPRGTRGRGRGRGRARGRGRGSFTIKLPGRGGEDGREETGSAGDEGTPAGEETQEAEENVEPMGGGKPFKKINGQVYIIDGDEYVTEDDPKGDTKIDINGVLLGGRRFKAQTFTLPNRHPSRQYMLAIDAARTSGFRDSLYYFRRNPLAMKLNATQWEKEHLIEEGKLGSHLKTRSVTLITTRSAYKLHGSKMILDGRWVTDDYYEDKSLAEITEKGLKAGDFVGELPDPNANSASALATHASTSDLAGAKTSGPSLGIYRAGGPTTIFGGSGWGPYSDGPLNAVRKSLLNRDGLNEENWMSIAAKRTVESNEEWARLRRENLKALGGIYGEDGKGSGGGKRDAGEVVVDMDGQGSAMDAAGQDQHTKKKRKVGKISDDDGPYPLGVYEPQTGIVLYRSNTQSTSARWEAVLDPERKKYILGGTKVGNGGWGLAWVDTVLEESPPEPMPPHYDWLQDWFQAQQTQSDPKRIG